MRLYDAHCHLQDKRLDEARQEALDGYAEAGVAEVVVNGTQESDWEAVDQLARKAAVARPSFGLHPWFVDTRSAQWQESLRERLDHWGERAAIGEIGLDRWIKDYDWDAQMEVFRWQYREGARRDLPVAIHCLQAWGPLLESIQEEERSARGFLIHSYSGSAEMVERFAKLGAYFSLSGYFAHKRKKKRREAWRQVPLDRLLIETDAPDMAGPDEVSPHKASDADGEPINHPLNLPAIYRFAAELYDMDTEDLAAKVEENYQRFFG